MQKDIAAKTHGKISGREPIFLAPLIRTGVVNTHKLDKTTVSYKIKRSMHVQLMRLSKGVWLMERRIGKLPGNRVTSPYIMCTGHKLDTP